MTVREFVQNLLLSCPKQEDLDREVFVCDKRYKLIYDDLSNFRTIDDTNAFIFDIDLSEMSCEEES